MKEAFYKSLIEYEKEQIELRQIEWMVSVKGKVEEREEQRLAWEEEKLKRLEERQKKIDEQTRREENAKKREEEWRKSEEDKQKKWEEYMLQKLDVHPFLVEIDLADFLLKYCSKILGIDQPLKPVDKLAKDFDKKDSDELRKKAINDALAKGKLVRVEKEREDFFAKGADGKKKRVRTNYQDAELENDDSLDLDIQMIKKFSRLNITAPIFKGDLERSLKELVELR